MESFRKLKVWQRAHLLTLAVYRVAASLPEYERFGLAAQLRRSAASIPANIAEACGRRNSWSGNADFIRFLHIAMGSATELEYHLLLAYEADLITEGQHGSLARDVVELQRMLSRFTRAYGNSIAFGAAGAPDKLTSSQAQQAHSSHASA